MMDWISDRKILIVGLGLMGGSYARGLSRLGFTVDAVDTDQASLDFGLEEGFIRRGWTETLPEVLAETDVVISGLYPTAFVDWVRDYEQYLEPGTMMTDVTGVKSCIVYDIQAMLPKGVEFVPAHPMAGHEHSGVRYSDDKVFRGANYIVTPTEKNTPQGVEWCKGLGRILGFERIAVMSPEEHDEMIGFVSQLAHCIAVSLMTCNDNEHLADYTGDSFRDLTRIAEINDRMWGEIFSLNQKQLLAQMDKFAGEFLRFRDLLARGDVEGMREKMRLATVRRAKFRKRNK